MADGRMKGVNAVSATGDEKLETKLLINLNLNASGVWEVAGRV